MRALTVTPNSETAAGWHDVSSQKPANHGEPSGKRQTLPGRHRCSLPGTVQPSFRIQEKGFGFYPRKLQSVMYSRFRQPIVKITRHSGLPEILEQHVAGKNIGGSQFTRSRCRIHAPGLNNLLVIAGQRLVKIDVQRYQPARSMYEWRTTIVSCARPAPTAPTCRAR